MGLDQFAYSINSAGEKEDIAYWRKHPNLHGWMEALWVEKGYPVADLPPDPNSNTAEDISLPSNIVCAAFEPGAQTAGDRSSAQNSTNQPSLILGDIPSGDEQETDKPQRDLVFNMVPLELTLEDLDELEKAINSGELPETEGFFFGSNADEHYKQEDLDFIDNARAAISCGKRVIYDSWW